MKQPVILSIRGCQSYVGQEPDVIELVTEGTMEPKDGGWDICYEESDLTGMEGVRTFFCVRPEEITLRRTGRLSSEMVFHVGRCHESLYQLEFGALLVTVCATRLNYQIDETGGTVSLTYRIEIEQSAAGEVDYQLKIRAK